MKARQELAQIIRVHITSSAQIKAEQRNGQVIQDNDFEVRLQSNVELELNSARVIEEWIDPKTGSLYLWLVTPIAQP